MKSIKVPHLTPNEDFVSVTKIFKNNGSKVKKGELIFEIETTKTSVEIESEHSGYIYYKFKPDNQIKCGEEFYSISEEILSKDNNVKINNDQILTEDAKKFVLENNIDISIIKEKIVTKEILKNYIKITRTKNKIPAGKNNSVLIVGASYHGKAVFDFIIQEGKYETIAFMDYSGVISNDTIYKKPVIVEDDMEEIFEKGTKYIYINTNKYELTKKIFEKANKIGFKAISVIHPSAVISHNAVIGQNVLIGPNSIIGNNVKIGNFAKVLNKVSVAHDTVINEHVQISDGSTIAGNVLIGKNSVLGINTAVINKTKIGENVLVLSGKTVIQNLSDNTKF